MDMDRELLDRLQESVGTPPEDAAERSRRQVAEWFVRTAPVIQWDVIESPLGPLYLAVGEGGLCNVDFGVDRGTFLQRLDPLARTERSATAVAAVARQLQAYFAGTLNRFDLALDMTRLTPFQQSVLQAARRIPPGTVRTYGQVAQAIGKPKASRAVGQALGRNPMPIVIPCHRVVAADGSLGGYSGGGGVQSKQLLLQLEGAL
jgi:O-6-methylguanine DNA methyltransferase